MTTWHPPAPKGVPPPPPPKMRRGTTDATATSVVSPAAAVADDENCHHHSLCDVPADVLGTIMSMACNYSREALVLARVGARWYAAFEDCCEALWLRLLQRKFPRISTTLSDRQRTTVLRLKNREMLAHDEHGHDGSASRSSSSSTGHGAEAELAGSDAESEESELEGLYTCEAFHRFKQAVIGARRLHPVQTSSLRPIEECNFVFQCPVFTNNLRPTSKQTKTGQPILHCDVCRLDVHLVSNQEELADATRDKNCVRFSRFDTAAGFANISQLGGYRVWVVDCVGGGLALKLITASIAITSAHQIFTQASPNDSVYSSADSTRTHAKIEFRRAQLHLQPFTMELDVDEDALPEHWSSTVDPASDDTYFYNDWTNETQWLRPPPPMEKPRFDRCDDHVRSVPLLTGVDLLKGENPTGRPAAHGPSGKGPKANIIVFVGESDAITLAMSRQAAIASTNPAKTLRFVCANPDTSSGTDQQVFGGGIEKLAARTMLQQIKDLVNPPQRMWMGGAMM